jgi:hypothetical protein
MGFFNLGICVDFEKNDGKDGPVEVSWVDQKIPTIKNEEKSGKRSKHETNQVLITFLNKKDLLITEVDQGSTLFQFIFVGAFVGAKTFLRT